MAGNKKKEILNKAAHHTRLNEARARRSVEPLFERAELSIAKKQTILIVCEGKNTEPSYFKQFRLSSATVKAIGKGYNTISLVEQATKLQEKEKFDQVWCVFDMDSNTPQNFNAAIAVAVERGFGLAYSNQAFEYWLILHFEDHQGGPMPRKDYNGKLNHYINHYGASYEGDTNKKVSPELFTLLMCDDPKTGKSRMIDAIVRAKRNYDLFDHRSPALEESTTTVFQLVEEILKYI